MDEIKLCPMKKFISHFYRYVFIEDFALSYNDGLTDDFCHFVQKYFDS